MAKRNGRDAVRSPEQRVGTLPNADLPPPGDDDPDERLLLRAFGEGDERAFSLVLERLFGSMMATAMRYVRTRDDAEEVVQETWLAALRAIDRFESRSSLKTWLFRILRYRGMAYGRRAARYVAFSDLEPVRRGVGCPPVSEQERRLLAGEIGTRVRRAIGTLPHRQREVLLRRCVHGWTASEVCSALGLSPVNQRVALHRARKRLRSELSGYVTAEGLIDARRARGVARTPASPTTEV